MPKFLIVQSKSDKKFRKLETSMPNIKVLAKKRMDKDPECCEYTVLTFNTRITLPFLRELYNKPFKKLKKHEACVAVDTLSLNAETGRSKVEPE